MPSSIRIGLVVALAALSGACTNDYGQFDTTGAGYGGAAGSEQLDAGTDGKDASLDTSPGPDADASSEPDVTVDVAIDVTADAADAADEDVTASADGADAADADAGDAADEAEASTDAADAADAPEEPEAGCGAGSKLCGSTCVADDDPANGCAATDCAPCALANATATCVAGACAVGTCSGTFADCNGSVVDGCEVDLDVDTSHCGSCTNACPTAGGTPTCTTGSCGYSPCPCGAGRANCNGTCLDGCETNTNTSAQNCGACGSACVVPHASPGCVGATCTLGTCDTGYADCNGAQADGCETAISADLANCGGCGKTCPAAAHATKTCASGTCAFVCFAGYADCDKQAADGCEANLQSDPQNCGLCGTACPSHPNAIGTCSGYACGYACTAGFADCNGNAADGCELPTSTDVANCGACGRACPSGFACTAGACGCTASTQCNAGTAGTCGAGLCTCGATTCAAGQRCLPDGTCG